MANNRTKLWHAGKSPQSNLQAALDKEDPASPTAAMNCGRLGCAYPLPDEIAPPALAAAPRFWFKM
jgi:hypothetical protein